MGRRRLYRIGLGERRELESFALRRKTGPRAGATGEQRPDGR
jgi:hypothetical protein